VLQETGVLNLCGGRQEGDEPPGWHKEMPVGDECRAGLFVRQARWRIIDIEAGSNH